MKKKLTLPGMVWGPTVPRHECVRWFRWLNPTRAALAGIWITPWEVRWNCPIKGADISFSSVDTYKASSHSRHGLAFKIPINLFIARVKINNIYQIQKIHWQFFFCCFQRHQKQHLLEPFHRLKSNAPELELLRWGLRICYWIFRIAPKVLKLLNISEILAWYFPLNYNVKIFNLV